MNSMQEGKDRSDWQHRYDESLAEERALHATDDVSGGECAAIEASGCLPWWPGAIALAVTGVLLFIRRRFHRS